MYYIFFDNLEEREKREGSKGRVVKRRQISKGNDRRRQRSTVRRQQRLTIRDWFDGSTVQRRDWFFSSICKKSQDVAFVIDGWALEIALKHYRKAFTELSILSRTAICCHVTPSQKAQGGREKEVIEYILTEVDKHIEEGKLLTEYKMGGLPSLYDHFVKLIKYLLENKPTDRDQVVILFQDMLEVVTRDIMMEDHINSLVDSIHGGSGHEGMVPLEYQLFASAGAINFPVQETETWKEKIKRLDLLLTVKESAMDVPSNLEARRRISFFSNSLFMDMPSAPKVRNMLSFSVLTPYYSEEVLFSLRELEVQNEDGVSILFYLQKIFPDEWNNFLERVKHDHEEEFKGSDELEEDKLEKLRLWASYRGQTLTRTVRGMMYYRKALELQAFLDMAKDEDLMEGYKAVELNMEDQIKGERSLWAQCQAVVEMKFTYVVSCQ
ncbi:hypothetical protein ACSBR2_011861 [Camellia fascicularis]